MKIEIDCNTRYFFERTAGWVCVTAIILGALTLAGYCVYEYRHERAIALQNGFTPNHTEAQITNTRTLVNEYSKEVVMPDFSSKSWESLTK